VQELTSVRGSPFGLCEATGAIVLGIRGSLRRIIGPTVGGY
jgi:hypothetical protein